MVDGGINKDSNMPKVTPLISSSTDLVCLFVLTLFKVFKTTWRKLTPKDQLRNLLFYLTITICAADDIKALITFSYPLINYLLRPVVCIIFFS